MDERPPSIQKNSLVIFSGGSAANSLVDVFNHVTEKSDCSLTYIIPISDNGGSSSELIRVFGGPGIGDVRSRLVRLIPDAHSPERSAIKTLFNHRLSSDAQSARAEWLDIVEARHTLWYGIASEKLELIRSFFNVLNLEIVKRARPTSVFNFESASVGNMFLTGARLFTGSFESAIYLLSSICAIPNNIAVLPAINTNFSHHICAKLEDGTVITGQNSISHPSDPTAVPHTTSATQPDTSSSPMSEGDDTVTRSTRRSLDHADTIEDANWPGSLPALRKPYIKFNKTPSATSSQPEAQKQQAQSSIPSQNEDYNPPPDALHSPIRHIYYINPYGNPMRPLPNSKLIPSITSATAIIYSIGSLYTSLAPSLILRGVGNAMKSSTAQRKILILNGTLDRETCSISQGPYSALDFVRAIARAATQGCGAGEVEEEAVLAGKGKEDEDLTTWVTHVIYIEETGAPVVDRAAFAAVGIELVRVYGRRMGDTGGWRYDEKALMQALEALVGAREGKGVSRRNTLLF